MEDAFFSQLDGNAVRELLLRTELRHAALFAVSDTLRIERCSDAAQQLSGLHPMEELDPFLSGSTRNILLRCINTQSACTAEEDIDGTVYTVEMIPHRGGALLAYQILKDTEMSLKGHAAGTEEQPKKAESSSKDTWKQREPKLKFTFKEQREFESIDDDIAKLEEKIETLDAQIAANATNSVKLRELMEKKEETENALDEKMDRWVYLNDLNEKIQDAKQQG